MPSTEKTQHLGLNKWVGSDKPKRADLVADNIIIDNTLKFITYELFGAIGDGVADDSGAILNAHNFANTNNLPVLNLTGKYRMRSNWNIPIKTTVFWGASQFLIDESDKGLNSVFIVQSQKISYSITDLSGLQNLIKKGTTYIPALAAYAGSLLHIKDTNNIWVTRTDGSNHTLEDITVVEKGGYLIGTIARDILTPNSITVYPLDDNYLTIDGGSFIANGNSALIGQYVGAYLYIKRSRVIVRGIYSSLTTDTSTSYNNGILMAERCFDVTIDGFKSDPRTYINSGTYAITVNNTIKTQLKNMTGQAYTGSGTTYWGAMGSNYAKDLKIYNCDFNRLDCHKGAYNVIIKDSTIGEENIKLTGGGDLVIENCTMANRALQLRGDYGSRWDGDIRIKDIRVLVTKDSVTPQLIDLAITAGWNFGYDLMMAKEIYIDGVTFDYTSNPANANTVWLINLPANTIDQGLPENQQYKLPVKTTIKNVKTVGRSSLLRLFNILDPANYHGQSAFVFAPLNAGQPQSDTYITQLKHNCELNFENIELVDIAATDVNGQSHFAFPSSFTGSSTYYANSFVPKISIRNCDNIRMAIKGAVARVLVNDSIIKMFTCNNGGSRSQVKFCNCNLRPEVPLSTSKAFSLPNKNCELVACKLEPANINGSIDINNITAYEFLQANGTISPAASGSFLDNRFSGGSAPYKAYNWILAGGQTCNTFANSSAADVTTLKTDFNNLLAELRNNGIIQ